MLLNNSHLLEKSLHGPQMVCMQYPLVSNVLIFTQHAMSWEKPLNSAAPVSTTTQSGRVCLKVRLNIAMLNNLLLICKIDRGVFQWH